MSDQMKDIINGAVEEEIEGALEELEEGLLIEVDDDDLEEVAGGKKHTYIQCDEDTKVRRGPGRKYKSIGTMVPGEAYRYTHNSARDSNGVKWYEIEFASGKGWVSKKFARKTKMDLG